MALARVKNWAAAEVLTASDLNAEFNNLINNALALVSPVTGAFDFDGNTITLDAAGVTQVVSSAAVSWNFTSGAKTGTPATTGSLANWSAQTFTDSATAGSGTATNFVAFAIQRPTLAATNALVTTTNAATVYIANAPAAGTNETISNAYALWVDDGAVRFDSTVSCTTLTATTSVVTPIVDSGSTGSLSLKTNNGVLQFMADHIASSVNIWRVTGAATGNKPVLYVGGPSADSAITGVIQGALGTGKLQFQSASDGSVKLEVLNTAGANNITIAAGTNPTISTTAGSLAITPSVVIAGANLQVGTNPGASSGVNIAYNATLSSRNSANSADITLITANTINSVNDITVIGAPSGLGCVLAARIAAGAATSSDIATGRWALWQDTAGGTTKLIYNNGGVLQSVALA